MKKRQSYKRGYPVALLVGLEEHHAVLWQIFSHVVKPHLRVKIAGNRTDEKALYNFHESVVDALRPILKEGVRSIVITAPTRTAYAAAFLDHVQKHHAYLSQSKGTSRAIFCELVGSADQPHKVAELAKTKEFGKLVMETTSEEAGRVVNELEKQLSNANSSSAILFSLKEIEDLIYEQERRGNFKTKYLMLTDKYLADSEDKSRINRLLQISNNRNVKTRIVNVETPVGKRISQFGGIVFFALPTE
jgi:stalled ribosome rescue protein Dom34